MSAIHPPVGLGTVPERAPQSQPRQARDRLGVGSWHIDAVLPPNAGEMVYEDFQPVAASIQAPTRGRFYPQRPFGQAVVTECEVIQEGNETSVFDDEELGVQVVELLGRRALVAFPCSSILRHLCLHVKSHDDLSLTTQNVMVQTLDKFFSFEVEVVDDTKRYRYIEVSNTRSVADVGNDRALLPLELADGWQRVNIDLERMVRLAFGTSYLTASQVTVRASARVAKVFFQSEPFSDYELPSYLRVVAE